MAVQRFLVRFTAISTSASIASLCEISVADAVSHGCLIRGQEDLSLVMGENCLAIEIEGQKQQLVGLEAAWKSHGLRIDNADSEVHELGDIADDDSEGEAK
jgi:hypothetical protein